MVTREDRGISRMDFYCVFLGLTQVYFLLRIVSIAQGVFYWVYSSNQVGYFFAVLTLFMVTVLFANLSNLFAVIKDENYEDQKRMILKTARRSGLLLIFYMLTQMGVQIRF